MKNDDFAGIGGPVSKRELKVFWLVDVSASMSGDKIATVNRAIKAVIPELKNEADENKEVQMLVRAMKFSNGANWHNKETKIEDFEWRDLSVGGLTSTGAAMKLMAQELTQDKMGDRAIPPVLILLSDGGATDDYDSGLKELLAQRWSSKSVRVAIAIGSSANTDELSKFCSHPKENPPLEAKNALDLIAFIKWASVDIPKSVSVSVIPKNNGSPVTPPPQPKPGVQIGPTSNASGKASDIW